MDERTFKNLLKNIPKVELHIHSEAMMNRDTVSEILSKTNSKYKDIKEVEKLFKYNNLTDFIKAFLHIQSAFKDKSDFELLFSNILPYMERNGIVYAEIFFSPSIFTKNGIKFEDIIDALLSEINRIRKVSSCDVKVIIDVSRTFGIDNASKNLDATLKYNSKDIIGIGLGGDERKGPAKEFEKVFKRAKEYSLHRVVHAGEDVESYSIWDAINYLGAERIGHGISAIKDQKLMEYLKDKKIPLEICPTSNVFTARYVKKIEQHPIKEFHEKGVVVTLNTDDPLFFNVELLDEYWNLYSKLKFSLDDIKQVIINGFKASFMSDAKKDAYIKEVENKWHKLFS